MFSSRPQGMAKSLSYESINLSFIFQEQHPEKLEVACQDKLVVCLPDASSVRTDLGGLDSDFFDLHILETKPTL